MISWRIYWLAGIWDADRGSTAKGVVSIKNKCIDILTAFIVISISKLGIKQSKFKFRVVKGYGKAVEVYYTSTYVRRIIEGIIANKEDLRGNEARAFLAGKIDGNGYVSDTKKEIYIGYGSGNLRDAQRDSSIVRNLSLKYSIRRSGNVIKLRLLNPRKVAPILLPFIIHPVKRMRLINLISYPPSRGPSERDPRP